MALILRMKYVGTLSGGRKRFRRRFPNAVIKVLGREYFQVAMKARDGADFHTEYAKLLGEYDEVCRRALRTTEDEQNVPPLKRWAELQEQAAELLAGVHSARDEDEARTILADDLEAGNADTSLYLAVQSPSKTPDVTLLDVKELYREERVHDDIKDHQRLDRIFARIERALGSLRAIKLKELKREHARTTRDYYLTMKKKNGEFLAVNSIKREFKTINAAINLALVEYDLKGKVANPFEHLVVVRQGETELAEHEQRDPLPSAVILSMRVHMEQKVKIPELRLIWTLLEGTGCRVSEVVGLRVEDVVLEGAYPHLRIVSHDGRRLKTKVSNRLVPLVGATLKAAQDAVVLADGAANLFERYAADGKSTAVSKALMNYLRIYTKYPKHVVYSLRHNMKDYLQTAGVPERDEHRILGHSEATMGDRVYGGGEARLKAAYEAMQKAQAWMP